MNEHLYTCSLCDINKKDNQEHLFQCEQIKILVPELFNDTIKYEDIYSRNNNKLQNVSAASLGFISVLNTFHHPITEESITRCFPHHKEACWRYSTSVIITAPN